MFFSGKTSDHFLMMIISGFTVFPFPLLPSPPSPPSPCHLSLSLSSVSLVILFLSLSSLFPLSLQLPSCFSFAALTTYFSFNLFHAIHFSFFRSLTFLYLPILLFLHLFHFISIIPPRKTTQPGIPYFSHYLLSSFSKLSETRVRKIYSFMFSLKSSLAKESYKPNHYHREIKWGLRCDKNFTTHFFFFIFSFSSDSLLFWSEWLLLVGNR